jgi:hypothetical protein
MNIKKKGVVVSIEIPPPLEAGTYGVNTAGECDPDCPLYSFNFYGANYCIWNAFGWSRFIEQKCGLRCYPGRKCPRYKESRALQKAWKEKQKKESK